MDRLYFTGVWWFMIYGLGVLDGVIFRYSTLCQWPERAHDHFRDALYLSPLASAASQLLAGAPVRVLNTIVMGSTQANTSPARWHSDYGTFTGPGQCDNGLIMWIPVLETSRPETNGMKVARRSHRPHMEYISNGTWNRHQASTSGHLEFMRFWRHLGESSEVLAPTLNLGDVLVLSKVQ